MNDTEVRHLVESVIHRVAPEADLSRVPPGADFREELELDSIDFLALVDELHERTGVDIPERDYPELSSIDGCVAYLTAHLPVSRLFENLRGS
jgi:acyl carrier protein